MPPPSKPPGSKAARSCTPGKPFAKGHDPRRNLKGRPRKVHKAEQLIKLIKRVLNEEAVGKGGQPSGMTNMEIGLRMAMRNPKHFRWVVETAFGALVKRHDITSDGKHIAVPAPIIIKEVPGLSNEPPTDADE